MLRRNRSGVFAEQHAREPGGMERVQTDLYCQHYGKSLSVDQLGGDLRLLCWTFSVRHLWTKMARSQRSGNPYSI
jgi:hypothetical protein